VLHSQRVLKKLALILLLAVAALTSAATPSAPVARAADDPCALPATKPAWIDFADGSVPFWEEFAHPGVIAAAANYLFPPQLRARGAKTIYWDMNLPKRVGTPTEPADPTTVIDRANRLYDYAAGAMECAHPMIAENELFGAGTLTPWSPSNAQYRANVLSYLRTLAARGATPVLLVSSTPYTAGDAADWWHQVSAVAHIVREDYFPAPLVYRLGPLAGSRYLRLLFRNSITDFLSIGIPPSRLGIMLGFQTTPNTGGREGLKPASAWFEVTKLQTLAANQVAKDLHLATVWSWGWGVWSKGETDPDKAAAACVYLWTRDPKLCDGIGVAGSVFNPSRTEGQLIFPTGVRCTVYGHRVAWSTAAGMTRLTKDGQAGFTAAYARAVTSSYVHLRGKAIIAAERAVVASQFAGSRGAYGRAVARAGASVATARGVIADELRRAQIESRLSVARPTGNDVSSFYDTYGASSARFVEVKPAPSWLGFRRRGLALATLAPARAFPLQTGQTAVVRTMLGTYRVHAVGQTMPLASIPLAKARASVATAVVSLRRDDAYQRWLLAREQAALKQTLCWRDQLPAIDVVSLTDFLPFLTLNGARDVTATSR
jgi:hypothetical protein